jgi:hypothetical protein
VRGSGLWYSEARHLAWPPSVVALADTCFRTAQLRGTLHVLGSSDFMHIATPLIVADPLPSRSTRFLPPYSCYAPQLACSYLWLKRLGVISTLRSDLQGG